MPLIRPFAALRATFSRREKGCLPRAALDALPFSPREKVALSAAKGRMRGHPHAYTYAFHPPSRLCVFIHTSFSAPSFSIFVIQRIWPV